jgi:alkanesulfonate monooxygenase SsuD/methylene tetrahydromethanopterin reductase-like flavin-dependent oxidoreductase (luciferase family)
MTKIPISVLELATVVEGGTFSTAISNTVEIAKNAENLGYKRFWMAEHHNMEYSQFGNVGFDRSRGRKNKYDSCRFGRNHVAQP